MREILFKAKRLDNGEWVEGYLTKAKWYFDGSEIFAILPTDLCIYPHCEFSEWIEIDKETICQFTGLYDKNGNKIWENDVVRVEWNDNGEEAEEIQTVSWGKHGWYPWLDEYSCDGCDLHSEISCIEVIGTTFDNPELLKGE